MKKALILSALLCAAAGMFFPCKGAEFALTKDGKSACVIIAPDPGSKVSDFAAKELSDFLGKISNGEKPAVVKGKNATSLYPVILKVDEKATASPEGYIIDAGEKGLVITSRHPRGILYGVFALLKESTGIRWVFPGADGEYFKVQPTIKVKSGVRKGEPSFSYRGLSFHAMGVTSLVKDTRDWMVRNGLQLHAYPFQLNGKHKALTRILEERGAYYEDNPGFTNLFTGATYSQGDKIMAEWFKTDKELFPLINGKRVCLKGQAYQPCTSNPETIRRSVEGLINFCIKPMGKREGVIQIYDNDGTGWCQCENCRKQDSEYDRKMNYVSNRFWRYFLAVSQKALEKYPDAKINGMAYQNFEAPPSFQIDKRFGATLSFNRVCYRHKIDDPDCLLNPKFLNFYKGWKKQGIYLIGREEMAPAGNHFQPVGPNYVYLLKFYRKMGLSGNFIAIAPPDGAYGKRFQHAKKQWRGMWQAMYLHAIFTWNIDADYDKEWEEMNSLFYGKGWEGGMREFYKRLWEAASTTPGCFGHGFSAPLGRCLDKPLSQENLNRCLASALKAASKDPDPRALAHVKYDAQLFKDTWEYQRKNYLATYRELRAYEKTAPIVIDGKLDEKDWKNADVTTRFKTTRTNELAKYQTAVKIAYDAENIYMGIECEEPLKEDQLRVLETQHDSAVWNDNGVEIFLNDPIMGGAYYQLIINSRGVFADGVANPRFDKSYESGAVVATSFEKGRYFMEIKIPARSITGSTLAAGTVLKMNVGRGRRPLDKSGKETSTWSSGTPHNVETFLPVTFAAPRQVSSGNRTIVDTRLWKNGSFDEVSKKFRPPQHWELHGSKVLPANWALSNNKNYGGDLEYLFHPGSKTNRFVRLRKGFICSNHDIRNDEITVVYRARGRGSLRFCALVKGKALQLHTQEVDSKEWKNFKFTFKRPGDKDRHQGLVLWPNVKSGDFIDVDDIYLR